MNKPYGLQIKVIELLDDGVMTYPTEHVIYESDVDVDIVGITVDGIMALTDAVNATKEYEYGEQS